MYFLLVHQSSIEKLSASQYLIICTIHQKLFESRHSLLNEMQITLLTNDNCCGR